MSGIDGFRVNILFVSLADIVNIISVVMFTLDLLYVRALRHSAFLRQILKSTKQLYGHWEKSQAKPHIPR